MKYYYSFILSALFSFSIVSFHTASSQTLTQTIKGKVFDVESQVTLPGANVIVLGTSPLMANSTNTDGNFKIENVPIGRYKIQINFMGYNTAVIPDVVVSTGKEIVLNIGLKQSIVEMNEVVVSAAGKDKAQNSMAVISAHSFTVEETSRYAGGMDDPARLVSAFAGVTVGNLQDNGIVIRGNSPKGVSWRLEGVEIPNPNHFAGGNVAGGGIVSIFSSQLLSNSDFFTGAFPAEYGDALAGVFDMKLRSGNSDKRESTVQIGMLGIDIASEGPFTKGKQASYLFNYRYSTTGLLGKLGLIPTSQVPIYQDLSFKLNFPTAKAGVFSVWGIGGLDNSKQLDETDSTKWESVDDRIAMNWNLNMGACGLNHKLIIGRQTYINTTIAASGTSNSIDQTILDNNLIRQPNSLIKDNSGKLEFSTFVNHKLNAKNTIKAGVNYSELYYNLNLNGMYNDMPGTYQNFVNEKGQSSFTEAYAQSKSDITTKLSLILGVNANYFALDKDYSIDPRLALRWEFLPGHILSAGYGKHSQLEELKFYLVSQQVNGSTVYPNKDLKMAHAQHLVLGYEWLINENIRLKFEPYFQYLYNVPGIADSSWSMINYTMSPGFRSTLVNNSIGKNMGLDVTFEHFFNKSYYYLVTGSLFDSKYKGGDGIWRDTRFNKGFVLNLVFGKEFFVKKNKVMGINCRFNFVGGERYSPVSTALSLQEKTVITDESRAFSSQFAPTDNLDFTFTYRINKEKHSSIWSFQVKNALATPMHEGNFYNYKTNSIQNSDLVIVLPIISYKIEF